ncbi:hypothetical protein E5082_26925 [Streptomyces griseoluteus]|uniref:Uncharacterized protein n=1 Tax=Streptomyces griseoluteus TaxID=29306 RepID=A0A4Z1D676_STRGP|nr:hypothetical protein [Streptomyces griseoluteus]TGN76953.1 hypothetical protein E5082_26925 [Streptomyces griseoluteus]GHF28027.1 hypothetical protein GCM10017776_53270 [Streptomyces griseoluteus]
MSDASRAPYPVVSTRTLEPPAARGWRGMGTARRERSELPRLEPHQVAVYRVGEDWVESHGDLDLRSETAVRATSVAVVDRRRDVPVEAMITVPSADGTDCAVRVRFRCTAEDSVELMREGGPSDASAALVSYLQGCPALAGEYVPHGDAQLAEVTKRICANVTAFALAQPPRLPGMAVELVSVDLLTPDQLRELQQRLAELEFTRQREAVEQAVAQERTKRKQEHEQELALLTQQHQEELQRREQEAELNLAEQRAAYEREQEALDVGQEERFGSRFALWRAYRRKELTAEQLADRLGSAERDLRDAEERRDETERALLERLSNLWREDLRTDTERADRRWEVERQEKIRELEAGREERQRRDQQRREDALRKERDDRQRADRRQEMKFELYKRLVQEGHTATMPIDMQRLLEELIGGTIQSGPDDVRTEVEAGERVDEPGRARTDGADDAPRSGPPPAEARAKRYEDDGQDNPSDIGDVGREEYGY